jgi:hypothetical protein
MSRRRNVFSERHLNHRVAGVCGAAQAGQLAPSDGLSPDLLASLEESKRYTRARVKPALMRVSDVALRGRANRAAVENRIEP